MFSTPYTPSGKAHGEVDEQYMLKTILTSAESFPYVKRRSQVVKSDKVIQACEVNSTISCDMHLE